MKRALLSSLFNSAFYDCSVLMEWEIISSLFLSYTLKTSYFREQVNFSHFHPNSILKTGTHWELTQLSHSFHPVLLSPITFFFFFFFQLPFLNYCSRRGIMLQGDINNVSGWSSRQFLLATPWWYEMNSAPSLQFHGLAAFVSSPKIIKVREIDLY